MHTYTKSEPNLWTVGYYGYGHFMSSGTGGLGTPSATVKWVSLKDFRNEYDAAAFVNFLNGGEGRSTVAAVILGAA